MNQASSTIELSSAQTTNLNQPENISSFDVAQQQHKQQLESAINQQQPQSTNVSSSSSSALTNSFVSPSSSLTSIPTNSPTSTNFSMNPISSDPINGSSLVDSFGSTVVTAGNLSESDKSTINDLGVIDHEQQRHSQGGASSVEECNAPGSADAVAKLVPTSAPSLISRPETENSTCDSILHLSTDEGLVTLANKKQQLEMLECMDSESVADRDVACIQATSQANAAATADVASPMVEAGVIRGEDDTDIYITGFDEQQSAFDSRLDDSAPIEIARLERSHSCSRADAMESIEKQLAPTEAISLTAKSMLVPTSISHEDLSRASQATIAYDHAEPSLIAPILDAPDYLCAQQQDSELLANSTLNQIAAIETLKNETTTLHQQLLSSSQARQASAYSGASRFFSSKLNTGSLWSLLSVGSNHSATSSSNANETMTTTTDNHQAQEPSSHNVGSHNKNEPDKLHQQQTIQDKNFKSTISSGFFNKVQQFKRQHSHQEASSHKPMPASSSSSIDDNSQRDRGDVTLSNDLAKNRPGMTRFRFQVKYIGSAMLHKNFTLPMLEWIARDIKRQTVKGAPSTSQRQFTIPAREIILEIQSYQLMGTSCKDGHCIFVHPMHCVSKYAQLQHDPNCFSYLIRDTKESPYFCHVFQAKSTNKVHEIFSAIREATTTQTSLAAKPIASAQGSLLDRGSLSSANAAASNRDRPLVSGTQKLANNDGQARNILAQSLIRNARQNDTGSPSTAPIGYVQSPSTVFSSSDSANNGLENPHAENGQFENSYQFEVMFVKKVKLQCRRVPASFVDDALETLKSFDVLKGSDAKAQIKGIGKRIISASVDERQEYDEVCQSPTPSTNQLHERLSNSPTKISQSIDTENAEAELRRGSSASLNANHSIVKEERESRSCQQSPTKINTASDDHQSDINADITKKHHQSMSCLDNLDSTIKSAKLRETPHYVNDFSPYNTITSNDLNERIAAIPVVSSSVSLDHETRQKLARQVRETIMATAANIKKDVYASGDKIDSSSSFKVLDSLSCTAVSSVPSIGDSEPQVEAEKYTYEQKKFSQTSGECSTSRPATTQTISPDQRRSSATAGPFFQPNSQTTNNFDLFRRASARQVVKNRTMLLLIGKDELCTISIDKHQVLFSKSFSSIVHCLQGSNNRDHFGLICRDSGKVNPNTESYAGLIFKCQSDKVVREIMGALKQVIYNSQNNYHGYNSIYNPLNVAAQQMTTKNQISPKLDRAHPTTSSSSLRTSAQVSLSDANKSLGSPLDPTNVTRSLAAKRGFPNHLELDTSKVHSQSSDYRTTVGTAPPSTSTSSILSSKSGSSSAAVKAPKNLIKSMFCDNCPLYWYHRLCCDIESLPAEASKSIIMRRINSSLAEREQDEIYSKFSEFNIESIDEHNEIFMSLLRHICERNQLRHNQTQTHQAAIAKSNPNPAKQSTNPSIAHRQSSLQTSTTSNSITSSIVSNSSSLANAFGRSSSSATGGGNAISGHHRSGSSGGSLGFVLGQTSNPQYNSDAGTMAIDNLKRAKNNLSVSIENMLKRRSSIRDEADERQQTVNNSGPTTREACMPMRSGSFRSASRDSRAAAAANPAEQDDSGTNLKRSSSTSDYSSEKQLNQPYINSVASWRDSFSRTINDDLTNPLMGLFRRRSSTFSTKPSEVNEDLSCQRNETFADGTNKLESHKHYVTPQHQPASPSTSESRFNLGSAQMNGGSSPSSMLSSAFWKKSIFDKIRQPQVDDTKQIDCSTSIRDSPREGALDQDAMPATKRTREELRSLWKKAILEQITLIKMDKQNQRLQATNSPEPPDIQRIKLNYKDVPFRRDAVVSWERLLKQDPTQKVDFVDVAKLIRYGVPKLRRGEIWMFLMNQYQLRHGTSFQPVDSDYHGDANQTYRSLLSQLSTQQHDIFVDIGRTFPTHPYYSQYLSIGQLSLFNMLKAYSLLDQEVGYCQGLSFVAGILLLHVDSEDEAFELMRHLMFNFGLRKQYLPSMNALHLQLYQITRLLRDYEYEMFNHFDRHDISPSLYAAPWFLTLFASQFPLGFVARLLDLIFLMGIEAIFRVSLNLLAYHRRAILECKSLEATMDFMRNNLVKIDDKSIAGIFDKSMSIDLRNKLIEYEIEYTFYCAEDKSKSAFRQSQQNAQPSVKIDCGSRNDQEVDQKKRTSDSEHESTSIVADATATVIIQHLLANKHLKSLQSNYSY